MAKPTFEVVQTDDGHHVRFVAVNGKTVWTTEVYARRESAIAAIESLLVLVPSRNVIEGPVIVARGYGRSIIANIRDVDERTS